MKSQHRNPAPLAVAGRLRYLVPGGTVRGFLDMSMSAAEVTGQLIMGHTRDAANPAAPVFAEIIEPGAAFEVDATCPSCAAVSQIGPLDGDTLILVEHRPGCITMAGFERRAGAR